MNEYAAMAMSKMRIPAEDESFGSRLQREYRMANLSMLIGKIDDAEKTYAQLRQATNDASVVFQMELRLREVEARKLEAQGKLRDALDIYEDILHKRGMPEDQLPADFKPIVRYRNELRKKIANTPADTTR